MSRELKNVFIRAMESTLTMYLPVKSEEHLRIKYKFAVLLWLRYICQHKI